MLAALVILIPLFIGLFTIGFGAQGGVAAARFVIGAGFVALCTFAVGFVIFVIAVGIAFR